MSELSLIKSPKVVSSVKSEETDKENKQEDFLELLSRLQGDRIDGQRACFKKAPEIPKLGKKSRAKSVDISGTSSSSIVKDKILPVVTKAAPDSKGDGPEEDLFEQIWGLQRNRMEEQRATLPPPQPGSSTSTVNTPGDPADDEEDNDLLSFFDEISKFQVNFLFKSVSSSCLLWSAINTRVFRLEDWMNSGQSYHQDRKPLKRIFSV